MNLPVDLDGLVIGALVAARTLSFMMSMPILGIRQVPSPVRIAIGVCIAAAVLPTVRAQGAIAPTTPMMLSMAFAVEILVGLMLAFGAVTLFATVQFAGQMIGVQMGLALANVIDPTSDVQISVVSQVFNLIAVLIFLAIDGHVHVLRAFTESFQAIVPGRFDLSNASLLAAAEQAGDLFSMALRLALPVIISLLLVSLTLGVLGRTVPQLNILVLGFPIKILMGFFVIGMSLPLFGDAVSQALEDLPDRLRGIMWAAELGR